MTDEEIIRRELWDLVKKHKTQAATCKACGLESGGQFNNTLSGRIAPSDKYCKLVGWKKISKGVYEKIKASESVEVFDKNHARA